ncbi:unnamed protein product [Chondrus crispus]|uniref:Uncharacterized protein n=1 Tax=Chondrus crispus TaxID=2769 RepID=R7QRJ5_CHOCR|nr:unnamed protein product [Chondrus crispus]CDF40111.1 unnamed protein product [Chondrus crispus]|eukprot:XP_005710405.1 unnamed protein product [Chondrus crispus]
MKILRISVTSVMGFLVLELSDGAVVEGQDLKNITLGQHNRHPLLFPCSKTSRVVRTKDKVPMPSASISNRSSTKEMLGSAIFSRQVLSELYEQEATHEEYSEHVSNEHHSRLESDNSHDYDITAESDRHMNTDRQVETDSHENGQQSYVGRPEGETTPHSGEAAIPEHAVPSHDEDEGYNTKLVHPHVSNGDRFEEKSHSEPSAAQESRLNDEEAGHNPAKEPISTGTTEAENTETQEDSPDSEPRSVRIAKDEGRSTGDGYSLSRRKKKSKKRKNKNSPTEVHAEAGIQKEFSGVNLEARDGTNITHLSYMVFKIIKNYDIKSVVDIPCRNTLSWFPKLLERIDFEVAGFKYYCVDTDSYSKDDIQTKFSDAGSPETLHISPEEAHFLPKTDLVFSWDGPQQWGVRTSWTFFTALMEIRPTYLLITNNPTASNTDDSKGVMNLRKQPFHVRYHHLFLMRLPYLALFFSLSYTQPFCKGAVP